MLTYRLLCKLLKKTEFTRCVLKVTLNFFDDDENHRQSEDVFLKNCVLETHITKDSKSCQPTCDEHIPVLHKIDDHNRLIDDYGQYHPKERANYVKEFDFQYSDVTDEEMILLIVMLVDARDVYSQHIFDVGKTCQMFLATLTQC